MSADVKSVLIVNIENQNSDALGLFKPMYGTLEPRLRTVPFFDVQIIDTVELLEMKCLELNPKQTALLFVNELVAGNETVFHIMKNFIKGGALAIFCCVFVQYATAPFQHKMWSLLGLNWVVPTRVTGTDGERKHRVTSVGRLVLEDFEDPFEAKAHMLINVQPHQRLYSVEQRAPNLHESDVYDKTASMATYARYGKGAVSYVGNHNLEEGFLRLIVSLISHL